MKHQVLLILILLFSVCTAGYDSVSKPPDGKMPSASGFINIIVESNVNKLLFTCEIDEMNTPFREVIYESGNSGSAIINIPLKDFNCVNKAALNDFLSLLKADRHPDFLIIIPDLNIINCYNKDSVIIRDVSANVAGVTKKYDVSFRIENTNTGFCLYTGTLRILLSDLNIKPPVKYFGLVRVKNEVLVKFGLYLKSA